LIGGCFKFDVSASVDHIVVIIEHCRVDGQISGCKNNGNILSLAEEGLLVLEQGICDDMILALITLSVDLLGDTSSEGLRSAVTGEMLAVLIPLEGHELRMYRGILRKSVRGMTFDHQ
jgi:hypothetical protein